MAARTLHRILALDDFEPAARRYLPRPLFGFIAGAAETDSALRGNRAAFAEHSFVPRTLVDTKARNTAKVLFGETYTAPFGIPPMGATALLAYRGDLVLAAGAAAAGIPFILSGSSLIRLEDVARAGGKPWFQAYLPGDPARIDALVDRAAAAGYGTFVLTVDVPVGANRENNVRNGFSLPLKPGASLAWQGLTHPRWLWHTAAQTLLRHGMPHFENMMAERGPPILSSAMERQLGARETLTWRHLDQIRKRWRGRLVVKGILSPEDARMAREAGADGVIVSNHGGRQLDYAIAPLRALRGVRAMAGDMTVMLDGGVRRGTDVLKALALGADFVFVGRPMLFAAAIAGEAGVARGIALLREEINRDMALLGITSLDQMTTALLTPAPGPLHS